MRWHHRLPPHRQGGVRHSAPATKMQGSPHTQTLLGDGGSGYHAVHGVASALDSNNGDDDDGDELYEADDGASNCEYSLLDDDGDGDVYSERRDELDLSFPPIDKCRLKAGDTIVLEALSNDPSSKVATSFNSFATANAIMDFGVVRKLGLDASPPRFEKLSDRLRMVGAGVVLLAMVILTALDINEYLNIFSLSLAASALLLSMQCLTSKLLPTFPI